MYAEAARFPDLFDEALRRGGARVHNTLAGHLARLGRLTVADPDIAAGHFLALVSGDLPTLSALGTREVTAEYLRSSISAGVDTFLRAFGTEAAAR